MLFFFSIFKSINNVYSICQQLKKLTFPTPTKIIGVEILLIMKNVLRITLNRLPSCMNLLSS